MNKIMKTLDLTTPDVDGYAPELNLIGSQWQHSGNKQIYEITGFVFFGDEDRWAVTHKRPGTDITFSRTIKNFFGMRGDQPRYTPALTTE